MSSIGNTDKKEQKPSGEEGIAARLTNEAAAGASDVQVKPLKVDRDCAMQMRWFTPSKSRKHKLFYCQKPQYNSHANVANLRTLEKRLRHAYSCRQHLLKRTCQTERLAELMCRNEYSPGNVAMRYGKRKRMQGVMPAVQKNYYDACYSYDKAKLATLNRVDNKKVATLVEDGLEKAENAIATVQSTLKAEKEKPVPDLSEAAAN